MAQKNKGAWMERQGKQGVRRERDITGEEREGGGKEEGKRQTLRRHCTVKTSRDEGKGRGNEQGAIGHYRR